MHASHVTCSIASFVSFKIRTFLASFTELSLFLLGDEIKFQASSDPHILSSWEFIYLFIF